MVKISTYIASIVVAAASQSLLAAGLHLNERNDSQGEVHGVARRYNARIPRTLQEPDQQLNKRGKGRTEDPEKGRTGGKEERSRLDEIYKRQTATCGLGELECTGGGCCDGECCGEGCCPTGYRCQFSEGEPGCCPVGETCSGPVTGCTDVGYVNCEDFDFCCPRGSTCSLDAAGNAQCGSSSGGTGGTGSTGGNSNSGGNGASPTSTGSGNGNSNSGSNSNGNSGNGGLFTNTGNPTATGSFNGNNNGNGNGQGRGGAGSGYQLNLGLGAALSGAVGLIAMLW